MKNFHLPLPETTRAELLAAAERAQVAGMQFDLDPNLESAALEHLHSD